MNVGIGPRGGKQGFYRQCVLLFGEFNYAFGVRIKESERSGVGPNADDADCNAGQGKQLP